MLPLQLAIRLLFRASNAFARFVTWVSFVGLMLGVMILTVVVSVMNGFDHELRSRLLSTIPHITVASDEIPPELRKHVPQDARISRYFQGVAAVSVRSRVIPLTLYGIDPKNDAPFLSMENSGLSQEALSGLGQFEHGILLGAPLARILGAEIGDSIRLMTVMVEGERVQPKILTFELADTFRFGAETDYSLGVVNLHRYPNAQWRTMGDVGVQVQLAEPMAAGALLANLKEQMPDDDFASWETTFGELFQAVQLEKSMMFVLLLLVVAVAAFNIVAGQTMLVDDKRQNIAILRTMGATQKLIKEVFFLQGATVSITGTALGLILGVSVSTYVNEIMSGVEAITGMHLLDGSFFVEIPVLVEWLDLLIISVMALAICLLAAYLPARRAAELDPVRNLH